MKKKRPPTEQHELEIQASTPADDEREDARLQPLPTGAFVGLNLREKENSSSFRSGDETPILLVSQDEPEEPDPDIVLLRPLNHKDLDGDDDLVLLGVPSSSVSPSRPSSISSSSRPLSMTQEYPTSSPRVQLSTTISAPEEHENLSSSKNEKDSLRQTGSIGSPMSSASLATTSRSGANDLFPDIPLNSPDQTIAYEAAHMQAILTPSSASVATLSSGLRPSFDDLQASPEKPVSRPTESFGSKEKQSSETLAFVAAVPPEAASSSSSPPRLATPSSDISRTDEEIPTLSSSHQADDYTDIAQALLEEENKPEEPKVHTLETEAGSKESTETNEPPTEAGRVVPLSDQSSDVLRAVALTDGEVTDDLLRAVAEEHLERVTKDLTSPKIPTLASRRQPMTDDLVAFALKQNERERSKPLLPTGEVVAFSLEELGAYDPSQAKEAEQAQPTSKDTDEREDLGQGQDLETAESEDELLQEASAETSTETIAKTSPDEIEGVSEEAQKALFAAIASDKEKGMTLEFASNAGSVTRQQTEPHEMPAISHEEMSGVSEMDDFPRPAEFEAVSADDEIPIVEPQAPTHTHEDLLDVSDDFAGAQGFGADVNYTADDLPMFEGTSADHEIPVADPATDGQTPEGHSESELPWVSHPATPSSSGTKTITVQRATQSTDADLPVISHSSESLSSPAPVGFSSGFREQAAHAKLSSTLLPPDELISTPSDTGVPFRFHTPAAPSQAQRPIRVEVLRPGETQEEQRVADGVLLEGLLAELALHCGRACCFLLKDGALIGLGARGQGDVHRRILDILLPADAPSLFSHVIRTRASYLGPPANGPIDRILSACLGGKEPQEIAIYPVIQQSRVVALFYLDDAGTGVFPDDSEEIKALIRRAPLLSFHWSLEDLAALAEDLS
ncbi:MAG: hypothetical protein H6727_11885 [Myxococcales bacterium]|nr:hypothetical protein [Myxococcales bacterium]